MYTITAAATTHYYACSYDFSVTVTAKSTPTIQYKLNTESSYANANNATRAVAANGTTTYNLRSIVNNAAVTSGAYSVTISNNPSTIIKSASISGTTLTIVSKADNYSYGTATVKITQNGATAYNACEATLYVNVKAYPKWPTYAALTLTAGESSTVSPPTACGTVSFASNNTNVPINSSTGVITTSSSLSAKQTATITVSAAGTDNYLAESKTFTVTVLKNPNITTSATNYDVTYGYDKALGLSTTGGGGITYSYTATYFSIDPTSKTIKPKGYVGSYQTVTINAAANGDYGKASKAINVRVNKDTPVITPMAGRRYAITTPAMLPRQASMPWQT